MFRNILYLSLFVAAGWLVSCADHLNPVVSPGSITTRLRVKTLTLELPNSLAKVSAFTYDGQGRLSGIKTYQTPDSSASEVETSVYQYDAKNRLTNLRHEVTLFPRGSQANRVEEYRYTYNGAGQVGSLQYVNGYNLTFTYNDANKLVSAQRSFSTGGLTLNGLDLFTFTGNNLTGLASRINIPTRSGSDPVANTVFTYTHDNKVNPFYGVYVIPSPFPNGFVNLTFGSGNPNPYFGGVDNVLNLSQNNVLTQSSVTTVTTNGTPGTPTNGMTTYQYEYNGSNLPTVRRTTANNVLTQTLRFDYETY